MSARSRSALRLLLAAAAVAAAAVAALALADRRASRDLLPAGASLALEVRGAGDLLERLEDTRFAAALTAGPTYAWIERSEAVRALDELRVGIGAATGFAPGRRQLLDLLGSEAAVAWYPPPGAAAGTTAGGPWISAGRVSLRAWVLAAAARIAARVGLAGAIPREEVAEETVFTVGQGSAAMHVFATGRHLVAGNDRALVHSAARLAAGRGPALTGEEAWQRVFAPLPAQRELRVWVRGDILTDWARVRTREPVRAAGAVLSTHAPVTVDVFVDAPDPSRELRGGSDAPPGLALAAPAPLLFHAAAGPAPVPLVDLLEGRAAAVARRSGLPAPPLPPLGLGFAFAVTGAEESGFFPRPHGIATIGMRDAAAARQALRLLFPAGARSGGGRWGETLTTRESFPLAGEFELWGAAAGDRLVLATGRGLIESLETRASPDARTGAAADPGFRPLDSVTTLNVPKLLPALRRYAPPLAGLLSARYRGLPDVSRDFDLLSAVRSVGVISGASPAGILSRITLEVRDLPATR